MERDAVDRALLLLGSNVVLAGKFACVVAGHPSDCIARMRFDGGERGSGTWRYCCHQGWRSLAEARACVVAGYDVGPLPPGTQRMWYDRYAIEAGLVEAPPTVLLPALSLRVANLARAAEVGLAAVHRLYGGFGLLLRVRSLRKPGERMAMLVPEFAGPWSGLSISVAKKARSVLVDVGAIHEAGSHTLANGGLPAKLWALGPGGSTT